MLINCHECCTPGPTGGACWNCGSTISSSEQKFWLLTDKGDPDALRLVDGKIDGQVHYSRQQPGSRQFTRNGQNLVFIMYNGSRPVATWVSFRPTPGKATRTDGRDAVECALFKLVPNHGLLKPTGGKVRASDLIWEATQLTYLLWGWDYADGLITFFEPKKTETRRAPNHPVGWSYRMAGWVDDEPASDGKPCLQAPPCLIDDDEIRKWKWSGSRGGRLREILGADPIRNLANVRMR